MAIVEDEERAHETWISVMPKVFDLAIKEGGSRQTISTLLSVQQREIQRYSGEDA